MKTTTILSPTEANLNLVADALRAGDVVGMPTETVYGLAANALDKTAVSKIFEVKGRPGDNPLIVHISDLSELSGVVSSFSDTAKKLADAFWPGPLTMILPKSEALGDEVTAGLDTVGVRMPNHPVARALIQKAGLPIAAPSANTSGKPSPTTAAHVKHDLDGKLSYILDGGSAIIGLESTVALIGNDEVKILRPGAITEADFMQVVGTVSMDPAVLEGVKENQAVASPGMKYKHYAPKADLTLVEGNFAAFCLEASKHPDAAVLVFEGEEPFFTVPTFTYGKAEDSQSQAEELFATLRAIDASTQQKVLVRMPTLGGVGMAVYNRLLRACAFRQVVATAPFVIGLTGPTGSGKSMVAALFQTEFGAVLDCDAIAKEARDLPEVLEKLVQTFGTQILDCGMLEPKKLADVAFADPQKHQQLNNIMYPAITTLLLQKMSSCSGMVLMDAPTLFESGVDCLCDTTVCVVADESVRFDRILKRDGIQKEQIAARMKVQQPLSYYQSRADFILQNQDSKNALLQKAGELFGGFKNKTTQI